MVAGGVPDRRADHAESMAAVALEFKTKVKQINVPDTERVLIRIGNLLRPALPKYIILYCIVFRQPSTRHFSRTVAHDLWKFQ